MFEIKHNIDELARWARVTAPQQAQFAAALALTRTAKDVKARIDQELPVVFDNPTRYTLRGFRVYPATKRRLTASVEFRPSFGTGSHARDYLAPGVVGGPRKVKAFERALQNVGLLPSGMAAVPGEAARLDRHGNMKASQIVQLLSYFRAFGEQGYSANMKSDRRAALAKGNSKRRGVSYFVGRPGGGKLPLGIWQRTSFGAWGTAIKPVLMFVKRPTYKRRLDLERIADETVAKRLAPNFEAAWKTAMATRKPGR